jgi:hypothetical protein
MVSYRCLICQKAFSSESDKEAEQLYTDHLENCMEPAKDNIKDLMEMFGLTTKKKEKKHERENS